MRNIINKSRNFREGLEKMFYSPAFTNIISEMERIRKMETTKLFLILGPFWLICIIWWVCVSSMPPKNVENINSGNDSFLIIYTMVLLLGSAVYTIKAYKDFASNLKKRLYPIMTDIIGNFEWFDENKALVKVIDDDELKSSSLFGYYNKRDYDDAFEGIHKGVKFKISETHLMHESGSGKRRRVYTVFKGVIIEFATNKHAKFPTIVATKDDKYIKNKPGLAAIALTFFACWIQFAKGFSYNSFIIFVSIGAIIALFIYLLTVLWYRKNDKLGEEIKLEDPMFNKIYKVYSSDQIEARYLVTTGFMERFLNMQNSFSTKRAKCAFYGNKIMFGISTNRNLFEVGNLFRKVGDQKLIRQSFGELISILRMIDYFKLDENTGL